MDTNPIIMTDHALNWERQTGLKDIFWLPGVGDHGGGPTRDMLEVAQRWQKSPFFPQLKFSQATTYLNSLETSNLPITGDKIEVITALVSCINTQWGLEGNETKTEDEKKLKQVINHDGDLVK